MRAALLPTSKTTAKVHHASYCFPCCLYADEFSLFLTIIFSWRHLIFLFKSSHVNSLHTHCAMYFSKMSARWQSIELANACKNACTHAQVAGTHVCAHTHAHTDARMHVHPGAVKLVLCGHWMHLRYMHQWRQRTNFIAPSCMYTHCWFAQVNTETTLRIHGTTPSFTAKRVSADPQAPEDRLKLLAVKLGVVPWIRKAVSVFT